MFELQGRCSSYRGDVRVTGEGLRVTGEGLRDAEALLHVSGSMVRAFDVVVLSSEVPDARAGVGFNEFEALIFHSGAGSGHAKVLDVRTGVMGDGLDALTLQIRADPPEKGKAEKKRAWEPPQGALLGFSCWS